MHPKTNSATPKLMLQACDQLVMGMKPVPGGRHCRACQRTITDLRYKTNEEILELMRGGRKVCGVINNGQLPIADQPAVPPQPHSRWWKQLLTIYSSLSLAFIFPQVAKAQEPVPQTQSAPTPAETANLPIEDTTLDPPLKPKRIIINGSTFEMVDGIRQSLPFCTVLIPGTTYSTESDKEGNFELLIPNWPLGDSITLEAHYIGFDQKVVIAPITTYETTISLDLTALDIVAYQTEQICVTAGIAILPMEPKEVKRSSPRGLWYRMRKPFRKH